MSSPYEISQQRESPILRELPLIRKISACNYLRVITDAQADQTSAVNRINCCFRAITPDTRLVLGSLFEYQRARLLCNALKSVPDSCKGIFLASKQANEVR